jgi:hypothetical protein
MRKENKLQIGSTHIFRAKKPRTSKDKYVIEPMHLHRDLATV